MIYESKNPARIAELLPLGRMSDGPDNDSNKIACVIQMIQEYFEPTFKMIEIGCFEGGTSEVFALYCDHVYCIDPYTDTGDFSQESEALLIKAEAIWLERMAKYPNVSKIKLTSKVAMKQFADNSVDAVYVDGDHRYDSVITDMTEAIRVVRPGGIVCGHDYYGGIQQAVDRMVPIDKRYDDSSYVWVKR